MSDTVMLTLLTCVRNVILSSVVVLTGCNTGKLLGGAAACAGDANCPSGQACCSGVCKDDCGSDDTAVVTVTFSTDYVPGYDFDTIEVTIENDKRIYQVTPVSELVNSRTIAQFIGVSFSEHTLNATLQLAGDDVTNNKVQFTVTSDQTVPVVLTRAETTYCTQASDCTAAGCTAPLCNHNICFALPVDAKCALEQRCVADCVTRQHECDVDGDCDDGASCTKETCSNGACVVTPGACDAGVCAPSALTAQPTTGCTETPCSGRASGFVCRSKKDVCDVEEVCDGVNDACPPDEVEKATTVCREKTGTCDVTETCDGTSSACPPDIVAPATLVCHPSLGACDPVEKCDGGGRCPADAKSPVGTIVGPPGACSNQTCNGGNVPVTTPTNEGSSCDPSSCNMCQNGSCIEPCSPVGYYCASPGAGYAGCQP